MLRRNKSECAKNHDFLKSFDSLPVRSLAMLARCRQNNKPTMTTLKMTQLPQPHSAVRTNSAVKLAVSEARDE